MDADEDKAWLDYKIRFHECYDESNYAGTLQSFVMGSSHRLLENTCRFNMCFPRVLEVGAGTGEHIKYVRHGFEEYILSDLDQETLRVAEKKLSGVHDGKLKYESQKAESLTYADNSFDRLIAIHVLEHIHQPHIVLREWYRVLKSGGVLSILIPTDPGLAWRLGRNMGPRRNALAKGIEYDYVMAREHVNSCNNLIALLRHYFPESNEHWWPLLVPSIDLNLFFAFHSVILKK